MKKFSLLILVLSFIYSSCSKPGLGGKAEIHLNAKHHSTLVPYTKVYIKYDAKDFPGEDLSTYDASITTDAMAHGHFHDLKKGNYYIYGVGFDSTINQVVTGGLNVKITKKDEMAEVTLPVTEGD
jgi:hypothetical protein